MSQRLAIRGGAILLILAAAALSTARASQIWAESQAKSTDQAARARVDTALSRAAAIGVPAADLRPLRHDASALAATSTPSASIFWAPNMSTFYSRQAHDYDALRARIAHMVQLATAAARREADGALQRLRRDVASAGALDVDASFASGSLTRETQALSSNLLPREYAATAKRLTFTAGRLEVALAARRQYVTSLVGQSGGTRQGVVEHAAKEVRDAEGSLTLLGLLTNRARGYTAELAGLQSAVQSAPSTTAAAVKEYELHQELGTMAADYARTVPSKLIVVSTEDQSATLYQDGRSFYSTPVTTGGPELPTDHGVFHIYLKLTPFTFHSPWPPGSPFYYDPTPVQYWMPFDGGEGLHDAWWRSNFGPGSNLAPTNLGDGNTILGTHGCVNLPLAAAQLIWNWAPVGTTVVVH